MTKVQPWATSITHDGPTEHWRVTALLAQDANKLWEALHKAGFENLSDEAQRAMQILRRQLELTDYFLSGLMEGEKSCTTTSEMN